MTLVVVLLLPWLISVKPSNATQDGSFNKNTKINGENLHSLADYKTNLKEPRS